MIKYMNETEIMNRVNHIAYEKLFYPSNMPNTTITLYNNSKIIKNMNGYVITNATLRKNGKTIKQGNITIDSLIGRWIFDAEYPDCVNYIVSRE